MKDSFFRKALVAGGIFMFTGVMFGAFGAHTLKAKIDAYSMDIFEKGVFYQFVHALALLLVPLVVKGNALKWIFRCFIFGILMFSFSLYLLAIRQFLSDSFISFVGPITPIGGVMFLVGWLVFLLAIWKKSDLKNISDS